MDFEAEQSKKEKNVRFAMLSWIIMEFQTFQTMFTNA